MVPNSTTGTLPKILMCDDSERATGDEPHIIEYVKCPEPPIEFYLSGKKEPNWKKKKYYGRG